MRSIAFICCFVMLLSSCRDSDHLGYTRIWKSIHYKHETLGDDSLRVVDLEKGYISFRITLTDREGGDISTRSFERIPLLNLNDFGPGLEKALRSMNDLDSTSFIGRARELQLEQTFEDHTFHSDSLVRFTLCINELLSEAAYIRLRAEERARRDAEMREMSSLPGILKAQGMTSENEVSGMYYRVLRQGKGKKPARGAIVLVNYIGRFASGRVFDDTYVSDTPLEFIAGKPDQVIPGFSIGLSQMREGGKAVFVIPSFLGFGEKGSSSGIVPPYSTLIYEVELVQVRI